MINITVVDWFEAHRKILSGAILGDGDVEQDGLNCRGVVQRSKKYVPYALENDLRTVKS